MPIPVWALVIMGLTGVVFLPLAAREWTLRPRDQRRKILRSSDWLVVPAVALVYLVFWAFLHTRRPEVRQALLVLCFLTLSGFMIFAFHATTGRRRR
jgi:hypothetical protein